MEKVLITGSTGFIGRHLSRNLNLQGIKIRALFRRSPLNSDIKSTSPSLWDETIVCRLGVEAIPGYILEGVDTIFHLAGKAHALAELPGEKEDYHQVNVIGTRMLLDAAAATGVKRFVFFSSVKAMAEPGEQCVDESWQPASPEDIYGYSKYEAEKFVLAAGRESGMHVCCLRPALVYGPGVKGNLLRMIQAIDAGRFPPVPDTGNRRSMVHVDDLVQAAMLTAKKPAANGKTYIVTDGRNYSTRSLYVMLAKALEKDIPAWSIPTWMLRGGGYIGDIIGRIRGNRFLIDSEAVARLLGSACYSSKKLKQELDYMPTKDFGSALPEIIAFHRAQEEL